jgi:hypothetical protein
LDAQLTVLKRPSLAEFKSSLLEGKPNLVYLGGIYHATPEQQHDAVLGAVLIAPCLSGSLMGSLKAEACAYYSWYHKNHIFFGMMVSKPMSSFFKLLQEIVVALCE